MEFKVIKKEEILKTLKGINRNIMEFKEDKHFWNKRGVLELIET